MLSGFIANARRAGLWVPRDFVTHLEHDSRGDRTRHHESEPREQTSDWPHAEVWNAMALAQHYGLPTRILDWSHKPLVAAYFAARDAAAALYLGHDVADSRLCVWALHAKALSDLTVDQLRSKYRGPIANVIVASEKHSQFQSAQWGTFTVVRRVPGDDAKLHELDKLVMSFELPDNPPVWLYKLTLDVCHAPRLLRLLAREFVSASAVFPTYKGAAWAVIERELWGE